MNTYVNKSFRLNCDEDIVKHKKGELSFIIIPECEDCRYTVICSDMNVYNAVETILLDLEDNDVPAITYRVLAAIKAAGATIEISNR